MKILNLLLVLSFLFISTLTAKAMSFEEAFAQTDRTPMVVLIYAKWADGYQNCIEQYRIVQKQLINNYNFVELDIASEDTKAFNSRYHIYPNLPYVLMFRDRGKISRYIPRDCASSVSCLNSKLRSFIQ